MLHILAKLHYQIVVTFQVKRFFHKQHFYKNAGLKLAKNPENVKQHPEAERLTFAFFITLSVKKNNRTYSKNKQKNKCVCIHEIIRLIIMKMKMKMKKRCHRYGINRASFTHGHKKVNKKCLIMTMRICIKQHLSNI